MEWVKENYQLQLSLHNLINNINKFKTDDQIKFKFKTKTQYN